MGKAIIDIIGSLVGITGNNIVDTILGVIIGIVCFKVAFGLVEVMFDELNFYDSEIMSCVHWIIRVAVFVTLFWLILKAVEIVRWIFSLQVFDYLLHLP